MMIFSNFSAVCGGNLIAYVTPGYFSSSLYSCPNSSNSYCEWTITTLSVNETIFLEFLDFEVYFDYNSIVYRADLKVSLTLDSISEKLKVEGVLNNKIFNSTILPLSFFI